MKEFCTHQRRMFIYQKIILFPVAENKIYVQRSGYILRFHFSAISSVHSTFLWFILSHIPFYVCRSKEELFRRCFFNVYISGIIDCFRPMQMWILRCHYHFLLIRKCIFSICATSYKYLYIHIYVCLVDQKNVKPVLTVPWLVCVCLRTHREGRYKNTKSQV